MYRISVSPRARRELKRISERHRIALKEIVDDLQEAPYMGKPLSRELSRKYSYRIGMYRIIYTINERDQIIFILTVGHRATVYS